MPAKWFENLQQFTTPANNSFTYLIAKTQKNRNTNAVNESRTVETVTAKYKGSLFLDAIVSAILIMDLYKFYHSTGA